MSDNFYEPPSTKSGPSGNQYAFFDTRGLAKVISFLFYGTAVFSLVSVWVSGTMLSEIQSSGITDANELTNGELASVLAVEQGVSFIASVISLALIINYLIWVNKSYKNLYSLNAKGLNYSPGWAVGFWFIPIVNLVVPFRVVLETYRASSLEYPAETNNKWKKLPVKQYVYWWWFIYVGNGVLGAVASIRAMSTSDMETMDFVVRIYEITMYIDLVNAINCFLAAKVVTEISNMQFQRYAQINSGTDTFVA